MPADAILGHERVLEVLARHIEDAYGFRGLRLESITTAGETVAYRVLPPPYPVQGSGGLVQGSGGPAQETAEKLRLLPLDPEGRPRTTGARRLTVREVEAVLADVLGQASSGWAASATRTSGLEVRFGPEGTKIAFGNPAAVALRIPLEDPPAARRGRGPTSTLPGRDGVERTANPAAMAGTGSAPPVGLAAAATDLLPPSEAAPLLSALGLLSPSGQVKRDDRRKYNQIVYFLRLIDGLVQRLPTGREALVVDCGCGKSQLLFVLNYWITERLGRRAFFVGLDAEPQAVDTARHLQASLGYRNMDFTVSPIAGWKPPSPPNLVLSLHACDTATDEAIALGIRAGSAGIIVVPCCQHELAGQVRHDILGPVFAHPTLLNRFGDWLTDGLRALALEASGYSVDAVEYVSPLDTPKNIMLRAEKTGSPDRRAYERYRSVRDLFGVRPALDRLLAGVGPFTKLVSPEDKD